MRSQGIDTGQDDRKFFAPVTSCIASLTRNRLDHLRYASQCAITYVVPVPLIEMPEVFDIQHDEGDGKALRCSQNQLALQDILDRTMVMQSRQRIKEHQPACFLIKPGTMQRDRDLADGSRRQSAIKFLPDVGATTAIALHEQS
jgi:hypothetical protein